MLRSIREWIRWRARAFQMRISRLRRGLAGSAWPDGWERAEIESKWQLADSELFEIIGDFPHGGSRYGYVLNVRWDGIARRYTDLYYDTPAGDLFNALHSLRRRVRSTSDPAAAGNEFGTLDGPTTWQSDWHRFQYKRAPARREAVWFREEIQTEPSIDGEPTADFTPDNHPADPAIAAMRDDHPTVEASALEPILEVVAYRYRIELGLAGLGYVHEMSLDQVKTRTLPDGSWTRSNELEVEALRQDGGTELGHVVNVQRLFDLMDELEYDYDLTRSTKSKGGLEVPVG